MIIIINDDPVYLSWIRRHHYGFVLDSKRRPTKRNTTLHRSTCEAIKHAKTKRTHWTTAGRIKACSEDRNELVEWAAEQIGHEPNTCDACNPTQTVREEHTRPTAPERQLTKLENDIVSTVVESAVIHLDNKLNFQMTVADVADYLSKTPAQLSATLRNLALDHILELAGDDDAAKPVQASARVFPTATSLCSVPAFAELNAIDLQHELDLLHKSSLP